MSGSPDPVDQVEGVGMEELVDRRLAAGEQPPLLADRPLRNFRSVDLRRAFGDGVDICQRGLGRPAALLDELAKPCLAAQPVEKLALLRLGRQALVGEAGDDAQSRRIRTDGRELGLGFAVDGIGQEQADLVTPLLLDGGRRREGDARPADPPRQLDPDQGLARTGRGHDMERALGEIAAVEDVQDQALVLAPLVPE